MELFTVKQYHKNVEEYQKNFVHSDEFKKMITKFNKIAEDSSKGGLLEFGVLWHEGNNILDEFHKFIKKEGYVVLNVVYSSPSTKFTYIIPEIVSD